LSSFASKHLGNYATSVPDAASFYRSSNYMDDLAWNAAWLYLRTGNAAYKQAAHDWYMKHYQQEDGPGVWDNYDWDSNSWGAVVLLNRLFPQDALIQSRIDGFVKSWTKGSNWVTFTPKGMAYSGPWGSLRHVGNALFLMEAYANTPGVSAATKERLAVWSKSSWDTSWVTLAAALWLAMAPDPPPGHTTGPHPAHLLAKSALGTISQNPGPNPNTLYGALVGGPGANDDYSDDRGDFIGDEVATDYNAGFTGNCLFLSLKMLLTSLRCICCCSFCKLDLF